MKRLVLALCALLTPAPVLAAALTASPLTLPTVYAKAACGDVITLEAGAYPVARFTAPKDCAAAPIVIDARKATVASWRFDRAKGLRLIGGTYGGLGFVGTTRPDGSPAWDCGAVEVQKPVLTGPLVSVSGQPYTPPSGNGVGFLRCAGATVTGGLFTGLEVGLQAGVSSDVAFVGNEFRDMLSDGIQLGQVWRAKVSGNACHGFRPGPTTHPDCIQAYSRAYYPASCTPAPPSSDIDVSGNFVFGHMQGVFLGNHVRADACKGVGIYTDDGGFDRVRISANQVTMGGGNAIRIGGGRQVEITDNIVRSLPSAPFLAALTAPADSNELIRVCGNVVADGGGKRGWASPAC